MPLMDIGGAWGSVVFLVVFPSCFQKSITGPRTTGFPRTSGLQVYMAKQVIQERLVSTCTYNTLSFFRGIFSMQPTKNVTPLLFGTSVLHRIESFAIHVLF